MLPPITATLSAAPAVAALVADRIYRHGAAPQAVAAPYITWFMVDAVPENNLSDAPGVDRCPVQIDCWHTTDAGVVALATAARNAIEPHAHITGVPVNLREPETKLYRIGLQLDWWLLR
jgi:hypothetical protein